MSWWVLTYCTIYASQIIVLCTLNLHGIAVGQLYFNKTVEKTVTLIDENLSPPLITLNSVKTLL